jgi:hypothetical protein
MTSGVHSDHPEAFSESLGHRSPEGGAETVGVVEQRHWPIAPPILQRDLDPAIREGYATTTDATGNEGVVRLGRHGDRS